MKSQTKVKFGILILGLLAMSQLAMATAIDPISKAFPTVPVTIIQMISSLPSIGGIVAATVIGPLSIHISNKGLAMSGAVLVSAGGLIPILLHANIYYLLVCAALIGIGQSFISTMVPTLLTEYFSGNQKQKLVGVYQAMSSLGALIMSGIGGVLVGMYWLNVYYIYFMALVVLMLAAIFIPADKPATKLYRSTENTSTNKSVKLSFHVYILTIISFFITLIYSAFANNIGLYIASSNIGSTAITGLVIAIGTVGGFITGLTMGVIFKYLNNVILAVATLLIGIPFIGIFFIHNIAILFIASFLAGSGVAMYMARSAFLMSNQPTPRLVPRAMALFTFSNSLGGFVSPLFFRILGFSAGISQLILAGIIGVTLGIILLITRFENKTNQIEHNI